MFFITHPKKFASNQPYYPGTLNSSETVRQISKKGEIGQNFKKKSPVGAGSRPI
jgi:hypothetical protein